jgi:predicted acetyltransferase
MKLIPYSIEQMRLSLRDPCAAASLIGARTVKPGYLEMLSRGRIYAAKIHILEQEPRAWLLSTYWQMVQRDTDTIIGELGFKGSPVKNEVEIGYGAQEPYRNRGYMTEAVCSLCKYAFAQNEFPVNRIIAATEKSNFASQRVLEKSGFAFLKQQGRLLVWYKDRSPSGREAEDQESYLAF